MSFNSFPYIRLRRNRKAQFIRDLVQEHNVTVKDLVYPIFIIEGHNKEVPIESMPGQYKLSLDRLLKVAEKCIYLGIPAIALFPVIEDQDKRDLLATESYNDEGLVQRAIRLLKREFPLLGVFTDVALDPYTLSGHDGITNEVGYVMNDITNAVLVAQARSHALAGADFVCPSDMMDGRIGAIRRAFEADQANPALHEVGIMAYSTKYASKFYGPFRDAMLTGTNLGPDGKKTYQMNPANSNEAVHEASLDIAEGADIVMVKPGLPYLDIIYRIKSEFKKPTAAYHVSGEYAMLKAAAQNGWLDYDNALLEVMLCFKRAGCDLVWSYAALEVAHRLQQDKI